MKTKHTKGEWKSDNDGVFAHSNEFIKGNIICLAPDTYKDSMKNWKANAKLIAAAPELLEEHISDVELLQITLNSLSKRDIVSAISDIKCILIAKMEAIKKATE